MDLVNYGLREKYEQLKNHGDTLSAMKDIIDWESLRPMISDLFHNDTEKGGRPNLDPVLMLKVLFLQSIYGIVDEIMEREMYNRIDFMNFLDYPDRIPDSRTIWLFRERLSGSGMDKKIWDIIWDRFEAEGIRIEKGSVQDATFIHSDPGKHGRKRPPVTPDMPPLSPEEAVEKPDGRKTTREEKRRAKVMASEKKRQAAEERKCSRTRRSRDGTWSKKGSASHFGFKMHTAQGTDLPLIRQFVVSTASMHDSQVDLSIPGIVDYRDKGYQGAPCRGIDGTMDRASRNTPLTIDQVRRNLRISRKRSPGERPYSVIRMVMHAGHVFVTMVRRVRVKAMFLCLGYNIITLLAMKKRREAA